MSSPIHDRTQAHQSAPQKEKGPDEPVPFLDVSGSCRFFVVATEEPESAANHCQTDANCPADGRPPKVDPSEDDELHIQEMENDGTYAEKKHVPADCLHSFSFK